jgi:hypothetical protein
MNSDQSKIVKIITGLAGLAGSGLLIGAGPIIDAAFPGWGVKVIAYLSLASFAATALLQILGSSPPAGQQWLTGPKNSVPIVTTDPNPTPGVKSVVVVPMGAQTVKELQAAPVIVDASKPLPNPPATPPPATPGP